MSKNDDVDNNEDNTNDKYPSKNIYGRDSNSKLHTQSFPIKLGEKLTKTYILYLYISKICIVFFFQFDKIVNVLFCFMLHRMR